MKIWKDISIRTTDRIAELYSGNYKDLYAFGLKFTDDIEMLKDAINDVFGDLCKKPEYLENALNKKGYLLICVKHKIIKLRQQYSRAAMIDVVLGDAVHMSYDPQQEEIEYRDFLTLQKKIEQAVALLPARQKEIIRLRYFENLSSEEISERTGISVKTLYNTTYNALRVLKAKMKLIFIFCFLLFV